MYSHSGKEGVDWVEFVTASKLFWFAQQRSLGTGAHYALFLPGEH